MNFTPALFIQNKRDGKEHKPEDIAGFITGILNGTVADYQTAAWLMATYFKGMTLEETVSLTRSMTESGARYDLSPVPGFKVDKHSTGGVGDKVTLILAPLAAACGVRVPSMAGRGLGHSGGTVDKLEAIPGFQAALDQGAFAEVLKKAGCAIVGQNEKIAPADKKLYALRDVTATVDCIPLIVGSILSKKIAEGTQALVMDVKVGSGAFMKNLKQARLLASTIIRVGKRLGLPCRAVLSDMNQPLGYAVGNTVEIVECVEILRGTDLSGFGGNSVDLRELTLHLCSQMLQVAGVVRSLPEGRRLALTKLEDGSAWYHFETMVAAQGGDISFLADPMHPLRKRPVTQWTAKRRGHVTAMQTDEIGRLLVEMGGGRKKTSDSIDPHVGMIFHRKLGAKVKPGDPLVTVYGRDGLDLRPIEERFHAAVTIAPSRKPVPRLILDPSVK